MPKKDISVLAGRTIRCILFDFGDTLWTRTDKTTWYNLERAANQQTLSLLRTLIPPHTLPRMDALALGEEIRRVIERQIRDKKRIDPEHEPDFALMVVRGLEQLGVTGLDRMQASAIYEALRVHIPESRPLFHDTLSTLAALQQRGYVLGVVTNRHWGGPPFLEDLNTLGLLNYFDPRYMAISADLGIRKPNAEIFLYALNGLGFRPEDAAMVGDSLSADITGAKRLDIFAVWKPKTYLFAEARASLRASQAVLKQEVYALEEARITESANDESELEMDNPDDDYLIAYAKQRESKRKQELHRETKPDVIIENLSDLLDIFPGVQ